MDEHNDAQEPVDTNLGISRRTVLRRGAVVGGSLMWAAPAVQSISRSAFALDPGTPVQPPPGPDDCCTADAFGLRVRIPLLNLLPDPVTLGVDGCTVAALGNINLLGTGATVNADAVCGESVEQPGGPCIGRASVASLNVTVQTLFVPTLTVAATVITSEAVATCGPDCTVTGSSNIASLSVNGTNINVSNLLGQCNVDLLNLGLVTFNRQQCTGDTLTVDALHINVLNQLEVTVARAIAQGDGCACTPCA